MSNEDMAMSKGAKNELQRGLQDERVKALAFGCLNMKRLTVTPTKLIPAEGGTAAFEYLNSAREVSTVNEDPRFLGAIPEPHGALLVFSDFSCVKWEVTGYKLRDEVIEQAEREEARMAFINKLCDEIVEMEAKKAAKKAARQAKKAKTPDSTR